MAVRGVHNVLIGAGLCARGLFVTYVWAPETTGISLTQRNGGGRGAGRTARDFPARGGKLPDVPLRTRSVESR